MAAAEVAIFSSRRLGSAVRLPSAFSLSELLELVVSGVEPDDADRPIYVTSRLGPLPRTNCETHDSSPRTLHSHTPVRAFRVEADSPHGADLLKLMLTAGARPNFVKIAPIQKAIQAEAARGSSITSLLVHTGQHYDHKMSDNFFCDLGIPMPDVHLGVASGSHAAQTAKIMTEFEPVCQREKPDWVVVVGDVNSTLACSITAKKLGFRVAHIEAGLRSRDMFMPEEINRLCTDAISDLLFTTDRLADDNLRREGVPEHKIRFVGNVMIDALYTHIERARAIPLPDGFEIGRYAVVTLHRPSNVDSPQRLRPLLEAIADISREMQVVFPLHPRTMKNIREFGLTPLLSSAKRVLLSEPLGYISFLGLVANAAIVLTDSGGIQEETTVLGIPCLTLRSNTERPMTCECGTNVLVGVDPQRIRSAFQEAMSNRGRERRIPEMWDGHTAERIVSELLTGEPLFDPSPLLNGSSREPRVAAFQSS